MVSSKITRETDGQMKGSINSSTITRRTDGRIENKMVGLKKKLAKRMDGGEFN